MNAEEVGMLKRRILVACLLAVGATPVLAHGAPRGEAKATVAGKTIAVDYGRPSLNGRDMLAQAQVGTPWRMGADAATTLTTDADLAFGATSVPKGSYVLKATKTAEDKWSLNVLKKDGTAVADVPFVVAKLPDSVEMFTIDVHGEKDGGDLELKWGTTSLKASFTAR
jgi:Protein of unknown function (DUF2911)